MKSKVHRRYFEVATGQVHGRYIAGSGPTLILLHESPLSSFVYDGVMPLVSEWGVAYSLDTPGYGMSDAPEGPLDIPGYACIIREAIEEIPGPKVLVGSHTGASIAIELSRRPPEDVFGSLLLGVPWYSAKMRSQRLANWAPEMRVDDDGEYLPSVWRRYERLWAGCPASIRHEAVWTMLSAIGRYNWAYNAAFRYDARSALAERSIPIKIVAAEGEFLEPASRQLANEFSLPYEVVEDCVGQIPVRAPGALNGVMRIFCTELGLLNL